MSAAAAATVLTRLISLLLLIIKLHHRLHQILVTKHTAKTQKTWNARINSVGITSDNEIMLLGIREKTSKAVMRN